MGMMQEYRVQAKRIDAHGSLAVAKEAEVTLDTDLAGRPDAMNPVELLLSALAACMLKGIERITPMLKFQIEGAEVRLEAMRQDAPPKLTLIRYEIIVDSAETEQRLDLLHRNILKYGTISNTLATAVELSGTLKRKP
nr:OsmC family protein [Thioclava sp.]